MGTYRRILIAVFLGILATGGPIIYQSHVPRARAIAHIERLGGTVEIHRSAPPPFQQQTYLPLVSRSAALVHLEGTRASDADIAILRTLEPGVIFLERTQITDEGIRQLASFSKLGVLFLDSTSVTDACLQHLQGMPRLAHVRLRQTAVTTQAVAAFKAARPGVMVDF